ncbi:MAG: molybdenum cofactor biosynthesis protein MoaE [Acidobacteriota bacterium]|nr:molybdenum cofactor biosynthesis protein MoaE [Acidobacteriota bacterium]MDQ7088242.1 molybdenum cofactor biosynthesis protein MoaE [Acidobacteriota bacterium]
MIRVALLEGPLPPFEEESTGAECGSEIVFHGRVRGTEKQRPITALFYEHYEGMAERELQRLAEQTAERFSLQTLVCLHRVGEVPVGESSVRVVLRSRHRAEGIEALAWFVRELKRRVPIWKWGVTPAGERFPSTHCEGCAAAETEHHTHPPG